MKEQVILTAHYVTCCFCEKPSLPKSKPIDYLPRFYFKKAVKQYCKENGFEFEYAKHGMGGHIAGATVPFKCRHYDVQKINIKVEFI